MANTLTQTTLSGAITANQTIFTLASGTGISVGMNLYVIDPNEQLGELMSVRAISSAVVTVNRFGISGGNKVPHSTGAIVLAGTPDQFYTKNPYGGVVAADIANTPYVNITTGEQWLAPTLAGLNWVKGWNQPAPFGPTAAVASAAGAILPSGPLFHVTGTAAVTGFTIPVGFAGGSFTIIPDGAFTWTTAGNIALAGTAVVSRALTFTWESNAAKFYPSYV
jgi:hypothetical protein